MGIFGHNNKNKIKFTLNNNNDNANTNDQNILSNDLINIASWNLNSKIRIEQNIDTLINDLNNYKVDIACLQETYQSTYNYKSNNENDNNIFYRWSKE